MTATPAPSSGGIEADPAAHSAKPPEPQRTRRILALTLVLLLATWLRFGDLARQSLWFDEGVTAWIAAKPLGELIEAVRLWENTPPLIYLLVAGAIRAFGDTDFAARLPSALAGVASVWLTYRLGRYLFDWRVGVAAALWMAVAPFQVWFSQEVRAYMVMQALALASCECFLRLTDGSGGKRWKLGYVAATALLLWSQLYGVFVILAQNLYYFGLLALRRARRLRLRSWIVMQVAVALLFAPWLGPAYWWTRRVHDMFWIVSYSGDEITRSFWSYVGSGPMLLAIGALVAVALYGSRNRRGAGFCLLLAACPVVVPVILTLLTKPVYTPRYGIAATAGLFLLAAEGIAALRRPAVQVLVFLAVTALPVLRIDPPPEGTRDRSQWRQAMAELEPHLRRGDYVVLNTGGGVVMYQRYVKRRDVEVTGFTEVKLPVPVKRRPGSRVWLILHTPRVEPRDILAAGDWRVVSHRGYLDIEVWQLTDEPAPPPPE